MRRRLRKFLPIVMLAVAVQILAPIAACWAASIAASDPLGSALGSAFICHDNAASAPAQSDRDSCGAIVRHGRAAAAS
jgi:hypothetical protein